MGGPCGLHSSSPTGACPRAAGGVVVVLIVVSASLSGLAAALRPGPLVHVGSLVNPVGVEGAQGVLDVAAAVGGVLYAAALVATFVAFVLRFRRASTIERQQLSWFAVAVAIVALATTLATVLDALGVPETATSLLNTLPLVALPVAVAVAVLRHRLYDIDLVLDRALVGAGLAAFTTLDWSIALRDEAATAYAATLRARARGASRRGDTDSAARAHLRLLDRDRWDGSAHLDLVALLHAAGRHGEARRRYRTYAGAMAEIDVRPDEFPAAQAGSQPARSSL